MTDTDFMTRAIQLSFDSVENGGGPFGAVVVREGRIIGEGANCVVTTADPTAHAEVVAIRMACETVGAHALDGATIYTTCEPCPMCLGAIWWARIGEIVYGNSRRDAALIEFDDEDIYAEVGRPLHERKLPLRRFMQDEAMRAFEAWAAKADKVRY